MGGDCLNDYWIFDRQPADVEQDCFVGCDVHFAMPIGDVGFKSTNTRMTNFCKMVGIPILLDPYEAPKWDIGRNDDRWVNHKITYLVQITYDKDRVRQWTTSFDPRDLEKGNKAFGVEPVLFWQELEEHTTLFEGAEVVREQGTWNPYQPIKPVKEEPHYRVMMGDGTEVKVSKVDIKDSSILKIGGEHFPGRRLPGPRKRQ